MHASDVISNLLIRVNIHLNLMLTQNFTFWASREMEHLHASSERGLITGTQMGAWGLRLAISHGILGMGLMHLLLCICSALQDSPQQFLESLGITVIQIPLTILCSNALFCYAELPSFRNTKSDSCIPVEEDVNTLFHVFFPCTVLFLWEQKEILHKANLFVAFCFLHSCLADHNLIHNVYVTEIFKVVNIYHCCQGK